MTGPAELVTCDQTIEHTVRFAKQTLGWTTPRVRTPTQADRWTWLVLAGYTQLRLARELAADQRLAWERPRPPGQLSPYRVRRGFSRLLCALGTPASQRATTLRALPRPAQRPPVQAGHPLPSHQEGRLTSHHQHQRNRRPDQRLTQHAHRVKTQA
jgi:hypothetical protein